MNTKIKIGMLLLFSAFLGKSNGQTCCDADSFIYFNNQIDCSICLKVECVDPNSGVTSPIPHYTRPTLPLVADPANCPDSCNSGEDFLPCGSPSNPQTGKIIFPHNGCNNCTAFKFTIMSIGRNNVTHISVNTVGSPSVDSIPNSPCCIDQTPNCQMSFDCVSHTLTIKCVP